MFDFVTSRPPARFRPAPPVRSPSTICAFTGAARSPTCDPRLHVTCPWHGWQFDVSSGALVQDPSVGVTRHDTRVGGGEIQVRLTE